MIIAGVDEVGRGPLAGPVVSAAVILPDSHTIEGLDDSKKISPKKRSQLSEQIKQQALSWEIAEASVAEIDDINILQATMLAMQRAVSQLSIRPEIVMVDGNRTPDFGIESKAVIGGDGKVASISAASIIAKVYRDQLMQDYAVTYPEYGFEKNAGYPTKQHRDALQAYGVTSIHRRSFAPVKNCL